MTGDNTINAVAVVSRLKDKGYRITAQRQAMVEKLIESDKALSAYEIWEALKVQYSDISLDTVYRNLHVLVDLGALIPINAMGKESVRYELVCTNHHHHIVCVKCGKSQCLDYCPIDPQFLILLKNHGYELVRHNLELFGVCRQCNAS
ncbi:Fur family transcriptional regulator [Sporomusa malonica]|uniref:Zinc uptake regulator, Fur family n=1 Tax=Sporomusa malonica TaxID=112901 RepID=A0A1W2CAH8_9FIRM|nr:Fur family transcriptional regulator [Sporomusa malonica]SMC82287.1 zinc uptake regulator, Fur family [Sporomusa malonica]